MGYNEIVEKGKLLDYTEGAVCVEIWELPEQIVECFWLPQNQGTFPTTITYRKAL